MQLHLVFHATLLEAFEDEILELVVELKRVEVSVLREHGCHTGR